MKKMTIIAGALALALVSAPAKAHSGDMCNYNMDYDLTIDNSSIRFDKDSGDEITIDQDNNLFINGSAKSLDSHQQQLVDNYADGVRLLIPEVTSLAIEGVNLGVKAASMALGTLLGEGDPDFERFSYKITELADSITSKLDADNFSSKHIEQAFDDDFEQEIEDVVEEAVAELTPRLMAKIVTAAMSGEDGEISDLEHRAESLEHDIEEFVEPQVEALEARADELCASVEELDSLETEMVESGLVMMDLIEKGSGHNYKKNRNRYKFNLGD